MLVQYVAMVMDVSILQPTSSPILSYLMHGMNDSGTMPEWRLSTGENMGGYMELLQRDHRGCLRRLAEQ